MHALAAAIPSARSVAFDLQKHSVVVAAVNRDQDVVLKPKRLAIGALANWANVTLLLTDRVVIESTANAGYVYDLLRPLVAGCVVADSRQVKWIANAAVKTDKDDGLKRAKLLAAGLIPDVWVPPVQVRALRALMAHRTSLVRAQTRIKNRLQSVIPRFALQSRDGHVFAAKHRDGWRNLPLSPTEQLRLRHALPTLDHLEHELAEVTAELCRLSTSEPWKDVVPYLVQLPGLGLIPTMTALAAIGDITRFPTDKPLVGYAGLGAGLHESGQTHQGKTITTTGRRDVRRVLVEAAWTAVATHPSWKEQVAHLRRHKNKNHVIIAIARRLLVAVWHVLSAGGADRPARPAMAAFTFMMGSWKLPNEQRGGLTSRQVLRYHLMRMNLGDDLPSLTTGRATRRAIAPPEDGLALCPPLQLPNPLRTGEVMRHTYISQHLKKILDFAIHR
jgi:transposase